MICIAELMWPPDKANEIGKAFLEAPSLPDYITMRGPYISNRLGKGTRSINIFEFDAAKIEDANKAIGQRYMPYMQVQGLTIEIKIWQEAQDALELFSQAPSHVW